MNIAILIVKNNPFNGHLVCNIFLRNATLVCAQRLNNKLMRLESANRIDVVESKSRSEFDSRIIVDSDSIDLIESTISILI